MIKINKGDTLCLRKKMADGELDGVPFEAGYIPPFSLYVEAEGKIAFIDQGLFIAAAMEKIKDE